jgi:hypothetical protein
LGNTIILLEAVQDLLLKRWLVMTMRIAVNAKNKAKDVSWTVKLIN